jgi:hypothetical protein
MTRRKATPPATSRKLPSEAGRRIPSGAAFVPPYPPSWIDSLTAWIDRLPGPTWLFYVSIGGAYTLLFLLAETALGAAGGANLVGLIFLALQPIGYLAVIHYLDRVAEAGANRYFASHSGAGEAEQAIRYRLTTLPRRPTFVAGAVAAFIVLGFLFSGGREQTIDLGLAPGPAGLALTIVHFVVMWILMGILIYHTVHQLRTVRQVFARYPVADVYGPEPYHAFAGLALRTALLITLNNYGWLVIFPTTTSSPVSLGVTIFLAGLALVMFIWPLWGAHRLLVSSKAGALAENTARFKDVAAELHFRIDGRNMSGMDDLNKSLASLEIERAALTRIPTWPWPPGTLQGLVAAVGLPIAIWLVQFVLQRLLE